MSLAHPDIAPRADLPWLRHRSCPCTSATPSSPPAAGTPAAPTGSRSPDLLAPSAGRTSLDLSAPPPANRAAAGSPSRNLLDLDTSSTPGPLGGPSARRPRPSGAARSAAAGDPVLGWEPPALVSGRPVALTGTDPVVGLSAVQSGVGALTVGVSLPAALDQLRLLCAYQLTDGEQGVLDAAAGRTTAPLSGSSPAIKARNERAQAFTVDLLQVRCLRRLVVMACPTGTDAAAWAGALYVSTMGGARVGMSLERAPAPGVLVALSIVQVDGRLVVRAENDLEPGTLRDACTRHGFDALTWVDPWTVLA